MTLYQTLRLGRKATADQIKAAYRKAALKHHPDRNPGDEKAAERFQAVKLAYDILSDPARRAKYDATGEIDSPVADNRQAELLKMLSNCLVEVVKGILQQGGRIEAENVVEHMKQAMKNGQGELTKQKRELEKVKKGLTATLERITLTEPKEGVEKPENFLVGMARAQIAQTEKQIAFLDHHHANLTKGIEFLKDYRYRAEIERVMGWGTAATTAGTVRGFFTASTT